MADAGNMTLTYATDTVSSIRIRSNVYAWSFSVVAPESHAREHRAMYPHQRGMGTFMIQGQFLNYAEYRRFMDFLRDYAQSWLHPPTDRPYYSPGINVSLQRGEYSEMRMGVPIRGITEGDHVGQIGYSSPVIFQTIQDPLDPTMFTGTRLKENLSFATYGDNYTDENGGSKDDTTKFFYPFSPGSTDASVKADDIYGLNPGSGAAPATGATPKPDLASQFGDIYNRANGRSINGLMGS